MQAIWGHINGCSLFSTPGWQSSAAQTSGWPSERVGHSLLVVFRGSLRATMHCGSEPYGQGRPHAQTFAIWNPSTRFARIHPPSLLVVRLFWLSRVHVLDLVSISAFGSRCDGSRTSRKRCGARGLTTQVVYFVSIKSVGRLHSRYLEIID